MAILDTKTTSESQIKPTVCYFTNDAHVQEKLLQDVVLSVLENLKKKHPSLSFELKPRLFLTEIAKIVNKIESSTSFSSNFDSTFICPDGGIIYVIDPNDVTKKYPILISEMKTQGTLSPAKGNAIERLGKNVIALRTFLANEQIIPLVVFCSGSDFSSNSIILDRLATIAQFAPLNQINLFNGTFVSSGSYFYNESNFKFDDMYKICYKIATRALLFFASKYDFEV
ncbi:EcoRI family type II restriction endonuclease [Mycoplasmopsis arginini]|uniref:EcoRI family type II restriction endonuclease n=1 Tax=Mycoplasmopsis arginini TaxID=2094 RepID=A0ABZ2AJE1_MYCAR|nr:EcoRI family type II restriction endonuclease [Mycoplasmopsis arginini]VEU81636.1 Type-2 restriction enzyme RsrI [Mycoplasmopsis arginini]